MTPPRRLLRVIDPQFPRNNIYRFQARRTISLGPVMIATVADEELPWLEAEVITENNYRSGLAAPRDRNGDPDHTALQSERRAEIVCVSASITPAVPRALEIIRSYHEMPADLRPTAIIAGGWHAGDSPQEFFEAGADVVVHGEGEPIISDLVRTLAEKTEPVLVPGISYRWRGEVKRNPVREPRLEGQPGFVIVPQEEMDLLPHPRFGLVRFAKIKTVPVGRTRGCGGRCRFCRVKARARSISPRRFAEQIRVLRSQGWTRFFVVDDRSEEDLEGFMEWLAEIAVWREERRIRRFELTAQCRLMLASRPDVLQLMRRAGIRTVAIGFESPIPAELKAMKKPIQPERMLEWTRTWRRHGFFVHGMFIFGYPMPADAEPFHMGARERRRHFWRFMKRAPIDTLQVLALTPIIGTDDHQSLANQGRIYEQFGWDKWDGLHVVFRPDEPMTPQDLQRELVWLQRRFYAVRFLSFSGIASLLAHLVRIGTVTISLPFAWATLLPFCGWRAVRAWQPWRRAYRNAKRHFQAFLIILTLRRSFAEFERRLSRITGMNSVR